MKEYICDRRESHKRQLRSQNKYRDKVERKSVFTYFY